MANFGDKIVLEFQRVYDNSRSCDGCFFQYEGIVGCIARDDSRIVCSKIGQHKNLEHGIWKRIDNNTKK